MSKPLLDQLDAQAREMNALVDDVEQPAASEVDAAPSTPEGPPAGSTANQSAPIKPAVVLPGHNRTVIETAALLGGLVAAGRRVYNRGGSLVRLDRDDDGYPVLVPLQPAALVSEFERVAGLYHFEKVKGKPAPVLMPTVCTEQVAKVISHSDEFLRALPVIRAISRCPVLVKAENGGLRQVAGYDAATGILACGAAVPDVPIEEAVALLTDALADFDFATCGDHSRALAAMITPALVVGQLLDGRAPADLGEADESQAGKGYRCRLVAAIYNAKLITITERKGGVGSMEESFNRALISGANFICIDNVRGRIDSPAIESFMTEDTYLARALRADSYIDPRRVSVSITSNRAELTPDLARRSSCVRIRKRAPGYPYRLYPEGDILDHIRGNQSLYLGAVFAVVRAWSDAGRPRTSEARHDFRVWVQKVDWICQKILGACPIMEGHQHAQVRMTTPVLTWLRDLAIAVLRQLRDGQWLRTHDLVDVAETDGNVEVPGLGEGQDTAVDAVRKTVLQAVGRRLKQCFRDAETVELDDITVRRREVEEQRRDAVGGTFRAWEYNFTRQREDPTRTDPQLSRTDARTDKPHTRTDAVEASGIAVCSRTQGSTCITGIMEPSAASVRQCGNPGEPGAMEASAATAQTSIAGLSVAEFLQRLRPAHAGPPPAFGGETHTASGFDPKEVAHFRAQLKAEAAEHRRQLRAVKTVKT